MTFTRDTDSNGVVYYIGRQLSDTLTQQWSYFKGIFWRPQLQYLQKHTYASFLDLVENKNLFLKILLAPKYLEKHGFIVATIIPVFSIT